MGGCNDKYFVYGKKKIRGKVDKLKKQGRKPRALDQKVVKVEHG